jgi:hypothetical protein
LYTIKDPQLEFAHSKYGKTNSLVDLDTIHPFSTATNLAAKPDISLQDTEAIWEAEFDEDMTQKGSSVQHDSNLSSQFKEVSLHEHVEQSTPPSKPPRSTASSAATLPTILGDNPW